MLLITFLLTVLNKLESEFSTQSYWVINIKVGNIWSNIKFIFAFLFYEINIV